MSLIGRFEDIGIPDIFQMLSIGKKTGTLVVNGSTGAAMVVFKGGLVVRAEANSADGTFGHDLLRSGIIKESSLRIASEVRKKLPAKSVAEILFDLGAVSRDILEKAAKKRIQKVVAELMRWDDSYFHFELNALDMRDRTEVEDVGWEISEGISPEYLLIEGARMHDESFQSRHVSKNGQAGAGEGLISALQSA